MPDHHAETTESHIEPLRRRLAELEGENAQLKGRGPASRGSIDMLRRNTELCRQVEHLRRQLPDADLGSAAEGARGYLTIHQVASRLNTTAAKASRLLAKVETRTDRNGAEVVAADRFEQFILDTAAGLDPSKYL